MIKECEICKKMFDSVRGQKYCSDKCRGVAMKMSRLKYNAKVLAQTNTAIRIEPKKSLQEYQHDYYMAVTKPKRQAQKNQYYFEHKDEMQQATKKVFIKQPTTIDVDIQTTNIDYITRSITACKELDQARKKVQDIIDVLKIEQAKYNKEDFEFAHNVEGSALLTDQQKLDLFNSYHEMRNKRRNVKDVIKTLIGCIRYTPIDSEKILKDAITDKIKVDDFFNNFYKQRNGGVK